MLPYQSPLTYIVEYGNYYYCSLLQKQNMLLIFQLFKLGYSSYSVMDVFNLNSMIHHHCIRKMILSGDGMSVCIK